MRFRKAMNVSFVLLPIMIFMVGIPIFYLTFTVKDTNNMKKVLQEAAYSGALAATYAIDIDGFMYNKEGGIVKDKNEYPREKRTKNPVSFMQQDTASLRVGGQAKNINDCLGGAFNSIQYSSIKGNDIAAREAVAVVETYLNNNLNKVADGGKAVYTKDDYSIAVKFERSDIYRISGAPAEGTYAPYNKVTVSVVLNYEPKLLKNLTIFGNTFKDDISIYGTSSAITKTKS